MSEPAVRIAVSIKDRAVRQIVCNQFSTAGATVQVCADTAAIIEAADTLAAVVLGLGAAPEETFDALVVLRQRLATTPIYVITDAAGEKHAKRATRFGATQVISQELLPRRVGHLVQQATKAPTTASLDSRSPGWAAGKSDPGYEIQSMDLGAWLSVPANRRLLGMEEPYSTDAPSSAPPITPAAAPAPREERPAPPVNQPRPLPPTAPAPVSAAAWGAGVQRASSAVPMPPPAPTPVPTPAPPPSPPPSLKAAEPLVVPPLAMPEPWTAPAPGAEGAACDLTDCPLLVQCRAQHAAQNAAILEAHRQRDQYLQEVNHKFRERLQAEIRNELYQALAQQVAAAEATVEEHIAAAAAAVRREFAAAIRPLNIMVGALGVIVVIMGVGLVWHLTVL